MDARGTPTEKLPVTGSTICAESTSSIPWFSTSPRMFSVPSNVRTTPGTTGNASVYFCCAIGKACNWFSLIVVPGSEVCSVTSAL